MNTTGNQRSRLSLIGAGNVATHLAKALAPHYDIVQVYAPHIESASRLADAVGAKAIDSIEAFDPTAIDYVIVSIKDDVIGDVLRQLAETGRQTAADILWMHTAGSVEMSVFPASMTRHGVLYPLQTFSRDLPVDMTEVPFFIEASDHKSEETIASIARNMSNHVSHLDSAGRMRLHAAAVLACNMVMYMWALADDVLKGSGIGFETMRPLLQATLDKTALTSPWEGMTGPARRGDIATILKHIASLPEQQARIYATLSREILQIDHHTT
nr:DUF2520 domain-containing protein [Muribaculaceae bacterium]